MLYEIFTKFIFVVTSLIAFALLSIDSDASTKTIVVSGFWPPTGEMIREFSQDPTLNPHGWRGKNFNNSGYDVVAYYPTCDSSNMPSCSGDFEVDYEDTMKDFNRINQSVKPVAWIGFGLDGNQRDVFEIESNFKDYWSRPAQKTMKSSLPLTSIKTLVEEVLPAYVDHTRDAGDYLCGFMGYLIASKVAQPNSNLKIGGFIHTGNTTDIVKYKMAVQNVLKATIKELKKSE